MPSRVKKPKSTKKSSVVRSTVTGRVLMKKPSPKKPSPKKPSPSAKELASLIRTINAQNNKMLIREIKKAEAGRRFEVTPNTFANIRAMTFDNTRIRKNKNGNVIMRNAIPR